MTPYSSLAARRVCRMSTDNAKRCEADKTAKKKFDTEKDNDMPIAQRSKEIQ